MGESVIPPLPRLQSADPTFNRFQDYLRQTLAQLTRNEPWTAPPLLNGWANFGSPYMTAAYYRDAVGRVFVRGLVKSGTINKAAFSLPTGFRPSADMLFAANSNGAFGQLIVQSDGQVIPGIGSNASFSLNCSFDTR